MIAVIFEVIPRSGKADQCFDRAADLRPELEKVDGFISVERFQSVSDPAKFVSLSFWRDEAAVEAWYRVDTHHDAQQAGRAGIFQDYRIRVAKVMRDYDMAAGRPK